MGGGSQRWALALACHLPRGLLAKGPENASEWIRPLQTSQEPDGLEKKGAEGRGESRWAPRPPLPLGPWASGGLAQQVIPDAALGS